MQITAVMVMSIDGRTTRGNEYDIYSWTSPEDQRHFFNLVGQSKLIIMGAQTYQHAKPHIKLKPETLRVVLTSQPERFASDKVPGQLEFYAGDPTMVVQMLERRGYSQALVVGGARLLGSFLREGLLDQLVLTIEPVLFGNGRPLVDTTAQLPILDTHARLVSCEPLNKNGTLLVTYALNIDH